MPRNASRGRSGQKHHMRMNGASLVSSTSTGLRQLTPQKRRQVGVDAASSLDWPDFRERRNSVGSMLTHSLINQRTFTVREDKGKAEETTQQSSVGPGHSSSQQPSRCDSRGLATPCRPPRMPSKSGSAQENMLVQVGARLTDGSPKACQFAVRQGSCSSRPSSCHSSAGSSVSTIDTPPGSSQSRSRPKRVSFALDCKPAPPTSISELLSLCRGTSEEFHTPTPKAGLRVGTPRGTPKSTPLFGC